MSDKPKGYGALDLAVSEVIAELLEASGRSLRDVAAAASMSHNRLGKIKRLDTPPASPGEVDRIAQALGTSASHVFRDAERRLGRDTTQFDELEARRATMSDDDAMMREPRAAQTRDVQRELEGHEDSI